MNKQIQGLTPREIEIIRLLAQGMRDAEIAQLFGTAPKTVRNQMNDAKLRLGLRTRVQLALYAERCGLLKSPEESYANEDEAMQHLMAKQALKREHEIALRKEGTR